MAATVARTSGGMAASASGANGPRTSVVAFDHRAQVLVADFRRNLTNRRARHTHRPW
jgi:hypothetical protein